MKIEHATCLSTALLAGALITSGAVAEVDIASKPLFVTAGVDPNVIAGIDNSGSMDSEVLLPTNDGALWWHTTNGSFTGLDGTNSAALGALNYNQAGTANATWKKNVYLFPNGNGTGERVYADAANDHYAIAPFRQYAFVRSAAYNGMYYDPAQTYEPWPDAGGYTFSDVVPSQAPSDPTNGSSTFDLTRAHRDAGTHERFYLQAGMVVPAGVVTFEDGAWSADSTDVTRTTAEAEAVEYYPATYYLPVTGSRMYTLSSSAATTTSSSISGNCASPSAAHYLAFERNPSKLSGVDALSYDGVCLEKVEIVDDGRSFPSGRSYDEEMQNFANWWTYYRKRHLATRAGIGLAFQNLSGIRMGALTNNNRTLNGMYSLSDDTERDSFFKFIYEVDGNRGGTPNRETLDYIGNSFDSNGSIITESCQQNFALLFTDGFANPSTAAGLGNVDGSLDAPFSDTYGNTIADIAAHYYEKTLRSGDFATGRVPTPTQCSVVNPPLYQDCNDDLHMVTYGITLGARGDIFGNTHFDVRDAHDAPPTWLNPTATRNPVQVDDLYHAAVNSRGEMLNAGNTSELQQALSDALLEIIDRTSANGTSSSTSAAILQEDTLLYSVEFRSDDWSGNLTAREVSTVDGSTAKVAWNAEELLAARATSTRTLLTHNGTSGSNLVFAELSSAQQANLDVGLNDAADGMGSSRIAWLSGTSVAGMRDRNSPTGRRLLGDIVNSTPLYVGSPNRGYNLLPAAFSSSTYAAFRNSIINRTPIMATGANDGFLHVFNADTGDELFAYMPSELLDTVDGHSYSKISLLADPGYEHQFFVDGTPAVNDVVIGGLWKTVLVGSMGVGGRSIFAIDVTDPENVDASDVLWEFTDPDLGYGVSEVQVIPMPNGGFAAVFGNGYNSDNDRAMLFIVNVADGSLLAKIDTGVGDSTNPNGLAPVVASSWPQLNFVPQYVYGGDLQGNLWRFDVTDDSASNWDSAHKLFQATDPSGDPQPITIQPRLSLNPKRSGELIINFGTGSFFRNQDNSQTNPQVQTLYGIRETLKNTSYDRGDLLQQEITWQDEVIALGAVRTVRQISDHKYSKKEERGYFLDLIYGGNQVGERVISRVTFPSGNRRERVRFSTMTPSEDPCNSGRLGFIFDLDLFTGGGTDFSVFDINDDGFFNFDDLVDLNMVNAISGGGGEELTVIRNQEGTGDFFYDGAGDRIGSSSNNAEGLATGDPLGRQSWQQLR